MVHLEEYYITLLSEFKALFHRLHNGSRCTLRVCRPQAANILYTLQGAFLLNHWNPFVTVFISSAENPLIRGHKYAMISGAQMCYDDAIQEGMCL